MASATARDAVGCRVMRSSMTPSSTRTRCPATYWSSVSAGVASALAPFAPVLVGTVFSVGLIVGLAALAAWGFYERSAGAAALGALSGLVALCAYVAVVVVVAIPAVILKML